MSEEGCSAGSCSNCGEHKNREQQMEENLTRRMGLVKNKILVLSGKGGVGKSTVSVNLAVALALSGKKVGLLDIDIHGPSVPKLLKMEGRTLEADGTAIMPADYSRNLKVMSIGFAMPEEDDAVIWRGPMKHGVIKQFLADVDWGDLDYLVVDSPPGTGDEPLSIAQFMAKEAKAVIVTTPQDVAIADVRKSIAFCRKLDVGILGVVENMSGFVCPHCNETVNIFKNGGGEKMAMDMDVPFLGRIPMDPAIVEACDSGEPFVDKFRDSKTAEAVQAIVKNMP